ncbi:MAG: HD family phosphohydrolase [Bacilli bacterium]|nr:HD family phosphohydrolase [Bacilli bacterium]
MKSTNKISFDNIAKNIINKDKFNKLKYESHHGLTRYNHVLRVSKFTYKITKFLKMDYVSATRAALLHDYYTQSDLENISEIKKLNMHPYVASKNALKDFNLNKKELNAIESHMFPLGKTLPKYAESWVLTTVDKSVATYEQYKFKWKNALTVYTIFIINMILFGQK